MPCFGIKHQCCEAERLRLIRQQPGQQPAQPNRFAGKFAPLRLYAGFGYNRLRPRFRVNFTNQQGVVDRRRVAVDLNRLVVFGGATWLLSPRFDVSGELYAAPSDAFTARVALRAAL